MARDEDIFKKLKKVKPLVKQHNLQLLSQRDFNPKSTLNIPIENSSARKSRVSPAQKREPGLYTFNDREQKARRDFPEELNIQRPNAEAKIKPRKSAETRKAKVKAAAKQPEMFPEYAKPAVKRQEGEGLDVFSENVKPQMSYAPAPLRESKNAVAYEYKDISAIEESAESHGMPLRHELKYYINYRDYIILRGALKALMSPDPFADENGAYHVRSLYFDDIHETALREKLAGNGERYKYRIRIYNYQDNPIKFEKKYKVGQYIGKQSISLTHDEYDSIMAGEFDFLRDRSEKLAKELYMEMKTFLLRPRVIVDYIREAYVSPFENCRITFDKDLKAGLMLKDIFDPNAPVMPMYDTGLMVLEVKFNRYLPEFIKRVLNNINAADRCAISKYVICRKFD
ncbi:MAG: polyphosphate polymerase domain-containing protein [Burkholderiales bacterium]